MAETDNNQPDRAKSGNTVSINFQYKSRLFEMIFSRRKNLLELYNAVNDSHYTHSEDLVINTLENAVYMSMRNDISFLFDTRLNLYEHQSTWNPNLPFRFLEYIADLFSKITKDENIYGRTKLSLPTPKFIIFYNGIEEKPDQMTLKLSDLYEIPEDQPELELKAVMFNINRGHNKKLMNACKSLQDYAEYTARVREYSGTMRIKDAVEKAVTECIREDILKDFLSGNRAEAIKMSIYEYDQEKHMRMERRDSFKEGKISAQKEIAVRMHEKGLENFKIAEYLDVSLQDVQEWIS